MDNIRIRQYRAFIFEHYHIDSKSFLWQYKIHIKIYNKKIKRKSKFDDCKDIGRKKYEHRGVIYNSSVVENLLETILKYFCHQRKKE